jgi:hypothetical protein
MLTNHAKLAPTVEFPGDGYKKRLTAEIEPGAAGNTGTDIRYNTWGDGGIVHGDDEDIFFIARISGGGNLLSGSNVCLKAVSGLRIKEVSQIEAALALESLLDVGNVALIDLGVQLPGGEIVDLGKWSALLENLASPQFEILCHYGAIDRGAKCGAVDIRLDFFCLRLEDIDLEHRYLRRGFIARGANAVGIGDIPESLLLDAVELELEAAGIEPGKHLARSHVVTLMNQDGVDAGGDFRDDDRAIEGLDAAISIDMAAARIKEDGESNDREDAEL